MKNINSGGEIPALISEELNISLTTAKRALSGHGNVRPALQKRVRFLAERYGYRSAAPAKNGFTVGIAAPAKPHYFWDEAMRGIHDAALRCGISTVCSLYADPADDDDVVYCLGSLMASGADMYIVVPYLSSVGVGRRLTEMSRVSPVVFLCEETPFAAVSTGDVPTPAASTPAASMDAALKNTVLCNSALNNVAFVGTDAEAEGRALFESCRGLIGGRRRMLVADSLLTGGTAMRRKKGFLDAFAGAVPGGEITGEIKFDSSSVLSPSIVARELANRYSGGFDIVFVAQGFAAEICSSLYKLRIHRDVLCIGCECEPRSQVYIENGTIRALLEQNIYAQEGACVEIARKYRDAGLFPSGSRFYIPSTIRNVPFQ